MPPKHAPASWISSQPKLPLKRWQATALPKGLPTTKTRGRDAPPTALGTGPRHSQRGRSLPTDGGSAILLRRTFRKQRPYNARSRAKALVQFVTQFAGLKPRASTKNHNHTPAGATKRRPYDQGTTSWMGWPWASETSMWPKRAPCSKICSRSPTRTICAFAESKWRRAAKRTSSAVRARMQSR